MFLLAYLVILFVLPPLARWRWGLAAAIAVTVLELAFVAGSFYAIAVYKIVDVPVQEPLSDHPFARIRAQQAAGYALMVIFAIIPAEAALAGGALAVVWSAMLWIWRAFKARRERTNTS